jgi:hypothetical protein
MKNAVFWDVAPCRYCVNRRFGETYRLHLQGRKIRQRGTSVSMWLQKQVILGAGPVIVLNANAKVWKMGKIIKNVTAVKSNSEGVTADSCC